MALSKRIWCRKLYVPCYKHQVTSTLQLIPLIHLPMSSIPLLQPSLHLPYLPLMRRLDEIRLGTKIQYPRTIPKMTTTRDQQLILAVSCARVAAVVANVSPDVTPTIDERESGCRNVEVAVFIVPIQVGSIWCGDGLWGERAGWECPCAPLLRVVEVDHTGDEGWCAVWLGDLVRALLRAGAVEVGACGGVVGDGVKCFCQGCQSQTQDTVRAGYSLFCVEKHSVVSMRSSLGHVETTTSFT